MEKNIGNADRFIRLVAGFYMLGVGVNKCSNLLTLAGSIKIAEGITRWCPMLHVLDKNTLSNRLENNKKTEKAPRDVPVDTPTA